MTELSMSMFVRKEDRDALDEALRAARVTAARVVTRLQDSGTHWTLTAKPKGIK
jgi:outer membrane murein-binding lipoprotein Lpp